MCVSCAGFVFGLNVCVCGEKMTMVVLLFAGNDLGPEGGSAVAAALVHVKNLHTLSLAGTLWVGLCSD